MINSGVVENRDVIVFDGVCNLCNSSVNFIIRRDSEQKFVFTPMQSAFAQGLIKEHNVANVGVDTFLLVRNGKCYVCTDAAIEIAKELTGKWYLCSVFKVIPRSIRDWFYRLLARNRYSIFGRTEHCMVPTPDLIKRFIGIQ